MRKSYVVGVALTFIVVFAAIAIENGSILLYIAPTAILISVGIPLAVGLFSFGPSAFIRAFSEAFDGGLGPSDRDKIQSGLRVFSLLGGANIASAIIGSVAGLVAVLSHLSRPEELGSGIAITLLCCFYSAIIHVVVIAPFKAYWKTK